MPVEVGPLITETQVQLDDTAADGLKIKHARVVGHVTMNPFAAISFDYRVPFREDGPKIERAPVPRLTRDVAPPLRLSGDHRHVRADMGTVQQRHPHVSCGQVAFVLLQRTDHPAAGAHTAQIDGRLREYREPRRHNPVRTGVKALAQGHRHFVVNPPMIWIPHPCVLIVGGNVHVARAVGVPEVLQPPRIAGCINGHILIWDTATASQSPSYEFVGHADRVTSSIITADGKTLISGSWDGTVKIWDMVERRELRTLAGHEDSILSVALNPKEDVIASAGWDATIIIWDLKTGKRITAMEGHRGSIVALSFSADGLRLASASEDRTTRVWDIEKGKYSLTLRATTQIRPPFLLWNLRHHVSWPREMQTGWCAYGTSAQSASGMN